MRLVFLEQEALVELGMLMVPLSLPDVTAQLSLLDRRMDQFACSEIHVEEVEGFLHKALHVIRASLPVIAHAAQIDLRNVYDQWEFCLRKRPDVANGAGYLAPQLSEFGAPQEAPASPNPDAELIAACNEYLRCQRAFEVVYVTLPGNRMIPTLAARTGSVRPASATWCSWRRKRSVVSGRPKVARRKSLRLHFPATGKCKAAKTPRKRSRGNG